MGLDIHVDDKLKRLPGLGVSGFTTTGATATITGTLTAAQLAEIIRSAEQVRHEVVVVAGVVKVQPRS